MAGGGPHGPEAELVADSKKRKQHDSSERPGAEEAGGETGAVTKRAREAVDGHTLTCQPVMGEGERASDPQGLQAPAHGVSGFRAPPLLLRRA